MNANHVQLNGKKILEKDFKTTMRGYNQVEVDEYLDQIIKDYDAFEQQIEKLQLENDRLKREKETAQTRTKPIQQPNPQANYDVLKRLSNLEKEVFGKRVADS